MPTTSQPAGWSHNQGVSLLDGWFPLTVQIVVVVLLVVAIGWRTRRWRLVWLPASVVVALVGTLLVHLYFDSEGLATDPAPNSLWIWVGVTVGSIAVAVLGWRSARWWRRGVAIIVIPLALLATSIVLNQWVGYYPTVSAAWGGITAGALPDQVSANALPSMRNTTRTKGALVPVTTPNNLSHFTHRTEYVYLPPTWFAGATPPTLPVVMMIAGEFNTPADWIRSGGAMQTVDAYAAAHHGSAPVMVFVDAGGSFNNDTECVNGSRGNVADHLTKEVRPYVISQFHTSSAAANWGIVGWSMGGTCSVDLTVMHPDLFSSFVDIAGDAAPTAGTTAQTVSRLYGGNAAAAQSFDPVAVMKKHGPYQGVSAWYDDTGSTGFGPGGKNGQGFRHPGGGAGGPGGPGGHHWNGGGQNSGTGLGGRGEGPDNNDQGQAAQTLCTENKAVNITCQIHTQPGRHSWQFASTALQTSLPWLSTAIGTAS